MPAVADDFHLDLLRACEQAAPAPLFAGDYAAKWGLELASLEETLEDLRARNLVHVTDWAPGKGTGYALSPQGVKLLNSTTPQADESAAPAHRAETQVNEETNSTARIPKPTRPIISRLLLALNALIFLGGLVVGLERGIPLGDYLGFEVVNPRVNALRANLGALNPQDVIVKGQWWRLLTYAWVHIGLLDFALTVYILLSLAPAVERLWGKWRFLVLYLTSVWTGGCAALLVQRWAVGDSAAFHGLVASYVAWVLMNWRSLPPGFGTRVLFSKLWLVLLLLLLVYFFPGMTWQTSVGGAIGGALVAVPLHLHRVGGRFVKIASVVGVLAVPALALVIAARAQGPLPEAVLVQRDLAPQFHSAEEQAATVYTKSAVPLLRAWQNNIAADQLTAARAAFKEAHEQVRAAARALDDSGPFHDPAVTAATDKARAYLEEWSRFYGLLTKAVAEPPPWPGDTYRELVRQFDEIDRASRPLANSALFPSLYRQKTK